MRCDVGLNNMPRKHTYLFTCRPPVCPTPPNLPLCIVPRPVISCGTPTSAVALLRGTTDDWLMCAYARCYWMGQPYHYLDQRRPTIAQPEVLDAGWVCAIGRQVSSRCRTCARVQCKARRSGAYEWTSRRGAIQIAMACIRQIGLQVSRPASQPYDLPFELESQSSVMDGGDDDDDGDDDCQAGERVLQGWGVKRGSEQGERYNQRQRGHQASSPPLFLQDKDISRMGVE
ncbi:hypothetical protein IWX47DRAFT_501232 [Phyllosticta citricarpa]